MIGPTTIGAVVIGRNEGERLRRCLASLQGRVARLVYVDSGSTDGSVALARGFGAQVVALDTALPFTAARARNAGAALLEEVEFLHFVDGDCEVQEAWIETAEAFLRAHPDVAVVCGRRRERFPEASVYNRLCDWEWDTPVGEALACGGDALIRAAAFRAVGGYDGTLIAGEEPEMCVRLRAAGWRIWRLGAEMVLHDAAMTRFGQWWKRSRRGGFAAAQGAAMYGAAGPAASQARRALIWGGALPLAALAASLALPWGWLLWLIFPLQVARLARRFARETGPETPRSGFARETWERAAFLTLGKLPEALGAAEFHLRRQTGRRAGIIEYK